MSTSSSPPPHSYEASAISPEELAAAAERRTASQPRSMSAAQMAAEHDRRQVFRRMIDPGIVRPNSKEQAFASLKTLSTIAENLLREPDNPKFQQFKPTNTIIKRDLMDPKGTLEYAIELGFRPEVRDFQPYYVFNPRRTKDLKMGAEILQDFITLENEKIARQTLGKKEEKAIAEAAANKVKLAFMDDRKTKLQHDEMEKERRAARAARVAQSSPQATNLPSTVPARAMPGAGVTLSGEVVPGVDAPPSYHQAARDTPSEVEIDDSEDE